METEGYLGGISTPEKRSAAYHHRRQALLKVIEENTWEEHAAIYHRLKAAKDLTALEFEYEPTDENLALKVRAIDDFNKRERFDFVFKK